MVLISVRAGAVRDVFRGRNSAGRYEKLPLFIFSIGTRRWRVISAIWAKGGFVS
jgi:hypothetical protein